MKNRHYQKEKWLQLYCLGLIPDFCSRLVSYYYFLRYGDDYRKGKIRSHMGDKTTFDECVAKKMRDCDPKKLWQQVKYKIDC